MEEDFLPLESHSMREDDFDDDGIGEDGFHRDRPPEDPENSIDFGEDSFNDSDEKILRCGDKVAIAQMLLRKSKKCAAKYLKSECMHNQSLLNDDAPPNLVLTEVLDIFVNPGLSIRNPDTIKWLKWLISAGKTPKDFYKTIEKFDNPTTCSLVWTADFMAYRCRTCGISPCMSLCLDCFHKGDHVGHDYNMFKSQAGGACDCGNPAVMVKTGFCCRHNSSKPVKTCVPPEDLLILAKAILPKLLLRFILHCREHGNADYLLIQAAMGEAELLITFLQELCCKGAALRTVMTEAFCNPKIYKAYTTVRKDSRFYEELASYESLYLEALESIPFGPVPEGYEDLLALHGPLEHNTFLEEFVFWTVKFEFPQKLVCLLLNMRPDSKYEDAFARAFVQHYSRIAVMLVQSKDTDTLSHRVVHVSVQLFSDNNLAFRMTDSYHLLHVMILSLKKMMTAICRHSTLHDIEKNKHKVVYCGHVVMKNHCYWPLVSDLNNILSFKNIAEKLISDSRLLHEWISFLSLFQGMNNNIREMTKHVEYEPQFYYAAFSAELEASASPLWAIISHLKDPATSHYSLAILKECLIGLSQWFADIGFSQPELVTLKVYNQVSFHLPLHRSFALVLRQIVKKQGVKLHDVLPPINMLGMMLVHPLRVQVAFHEILNDLWARNGLQIKGQAMTYVQCHFCNSMVDPDLHLIQIGAMVMPKDSFCLSIIERFQALDPLFFSKQPLFQGKDQPLPGSLDMESKITMLESCLTFLATITTNRHSIGLEEEEIIQMEMMALICMGDKTHSQMMEHIPEKCLGCLTIDFESILKKVTKYCQPECAISGTMKQGTYVPQDHVWEDLFDPIFAQLRTLHKKDYQNALNRFKQYCRESQNMSKRKSSRLWPPYRMPSPVNDSYVDPRRILSCRTFHAILYVLLYKCLNEHGFSENLLSLAVYLLELTIDYQSKLETDDCGKEITTVSCHPMEEEDSRSECPDGLFYLWYSSDDLFHNATIELDRVQLKTPVVIETPESQEDISRDIEMAEIESGETYLQLTDRNHQPSVRSLASGSELVPYQEEATAMIPSPADGNSPNMSRPSNLPHSLDGSEQRRLMSATQFPSLLSGSEVMRYVPPTQDRVEMRTTSVYNSRPRRLTGAAALPSGRDREVVAASKSLLPGGDISQHNAIVQSSCCDEPDPLRMAGCGSSVPSIELFDESLPLKESLISLLIKLHSKLTGRQGSYTPCFDPDPSDSRKGGGPFFIAKSLNKLGRACLKTAEYILKVSAQLYPEGEEECSTSSEDETSTNAREEKRRKAKEFQKKIKAVFARKQKQFMDQNWKSEPDKLNEEQNMDIDVRKGKPTNKLYDCVICNQHVPSTDERPVGLVVFIQATNLAGQRTTSSSSFNIPTTDRARTRLRQQRYTICQYMREKSELLNSKFDTYSWYNSMDIGWEGGVYVQTCGHHIHLDCQQSYLLALRAQERGSSNVDHAKNEFLCPLCRQLSNSVIPISSSIEETFYFIKLKSEKGDYVADIDLAFKELLIPKYGQEFISFASSLENSLIEATTIEFPKTTGAPLDPEIPQVSNPFLFLFITSVFRINIEVELIQMGGSLVNLDEQSSFSKRSSLIPLLRILSFHAKLLNGNDPTKLGGMRGTHWVRQVWSSLTQRPIMDFKGAVTPHEREVPMLCSDPVSILLRFVLLLPPDIDPDYFQCIIYFIYRLVVVRASVSSLRSLPEKRREKVITDGPLAPLLALTYNNLRDSPFFYEDHQAPSQVEDSKEWTINEFTCEVREICLGFLRIASILKSHMMEESLPQIADPIAECGTLERYLGLWETCSVVNTTVMGKMCGTLIADTNLPSTSKSSSSSSSSCSNNDVVTSPIGAPVETQLGELAGVTRIWCTQFESFAAHAQVTAANIMLNVKFFQPRLLTLPPTYEELFQYYHQTKCSKCSSVPKDPAICLVCGTVVCLKQSCCKENDIYETVRHANDCGARTAVFLVITQSTILVVRGTRIGLWGCVHLDSYGEEDRDLKRGKPLFLSARRYHLLEQQWLNHMFDHTPRRWIFHRGSV